MSDPNKRFSLQRLVGDAAGGAVEGAVTGALIGVIDPTGTTAAAGAATGAVVGFVGGATSSLWGFFTDDPPIERMTGRAAALFTSVVGLGISAPLTLVTFVLADGAIATTDLLIYVVGFASIFSASLGFLLEDRRARRQRERDAATRSY